MFSGAFYFAINRGRICLEFTLQALSDAKQLLPICKVAGTRLNQNAGDLGYIRCGEGSCNKKDGPGWEQSLPGIGSSPVPGFQNTG